MSIFSIESVTKQFSVKVKGIIQVGAHIGGEVSEFIHSGAERIHLIEANKEHIQALERIASEQAGVITISNTAISDREGMHDFHLMSGSQSSSLLRLAEHQKIYPDIKQVDTIRVKTQTLDDNLRQNSLSGTLYNVLVIDVQGAELNVLKGALATLESIDVIICEVNFAELYENCPQIEDIDLFLFDKGFIRVGTRTPYHDSWGDAIYLRSSLISDMSVLVQPRRHKISMPDLGSNGQLANQLFQCLFLLLYSL